MKADGYEFGLTGWVRFVVIKEKGKLPKLNQKGDQNVEEGEASLHFADLSMYTTSFVVCAP
jgi:hypothetical protein